MLKSDYDPCQYTYKKLDNGMQVVAVQDPNTDKSAISANVSIGHFNDPKACEGLSHLLEHMLFLGNHLNPQSNHLSTFLNQHRGTINAETGSEHSYFYLDVAHQALPDAIEKFLAMLCFPLLRTEDIAQEILSIDAEFKLKQKDDLRRLYQVHKETCNPAHPFSQFSVGNLEVFQKFSVDELQKLLQELHQNRFKPSNISLCLVTSNSTQDAIELLENTFGQWPNEDDCPPTKLEPLYLPKQLGVQINIKPVKHAKRLIITFALPCLKKYSRGKYLELLSQLLGDEASGSLLEHFKHKGWATRLNAGGGIHGSNFKDFNINFQLTNVGLEHKNEILLSVFYYLNLIKTEGLQTWRFAELKQVNELEWHFCDPVRAIDRAQHISQAINEYPPEDIIAGDYLVDTFDQTTFSELLSYFVPQNMRIKVIHPEAETDSVAAWYDTPYQVSTIAPEQLIKWQQVKKIDQLSLPKPNPYVPDVYVQEPQCKQYRDPNQIIAQPGLDLWFAQAHQFSLPKGDIFLSFDCQATTEGLHTVTLKRMWIALLNEKLNQQYYQAHAAGLNFHLYPHQGGFSVHSNGFSAKQLAFMQQLLSQIAEQNDFSTTFEQVREQQLLGLQNSLLNKPINCLFSRLSTLLQEHNYSPLQMTSALAQVSEQDIEITRDKLLSSFYLEALVHGNWQYEQCTDFIEHLKQFRLSGSVASKIRRGVADLAQQQARIHEVSCAHSDAAVVMYLQAPSKNIEDVALSIITEQIIAGPFFQRLRTEKQLGYLLGSGYLPFNQHPGISFYIQSPKLTAVELVAEINQFLQLSAATLSQFESAWHMLKNATAKQVQDKDNNLSMRSQRLWMAIGSEDLEFSYNTRLVNTILDLDFARFNAFFTAMVERDGFGELCLVSRTSSLNSKSMRHQEKTELERLKNSLIYRE